MPLYHSLTLHNEIDLIIWKVEEEESFFYSNQWWYPKEKKWLESIHPKRRMEFLASRYILHNHLLPQKNIPLIKDEFGKLRFENGKQFLSISHSGRYSSFVIGPKEMGLDVQMYDIKILNILNKFLSDREVLFISRIRNIKEKVQTAILLWSAKEAIYKAHGKRGIQFNQQISLYFEHGNLTGGSLSLPEETIKYDFVYNKEEEFIWIVAYHSEQLVNISDDFL